MEPLPLNPSPEEGQPFVFMSPSPLSMLLERTSASKPISGTISPHPRKFDSQRNHPRRYFSRKIGQMHLPCVWALRSFIDRREEIGGQIIDMLQHVWHRAAGTAVVRGDHANQFS